MILMVLFLAGCSLSIDPEHERVKEMDQPVLSESGYASVNGLEMYYEIHGSGEPLVLLHGGLTTIDVSFAAMIPELAKTRQVIAVEQQAHGHTADIDRPLSFEQMADDTAALLHQLGIEQADIFGYSDGGNVGLGLAIRHPELVRKLAIAGTNYNNDGIYPEVLEFMKNAKPEDLGEEMAGLYAAVAPNPEDWPTLVDKVMTMAVEWQGWSSEQIQAINAPVLVIVGDGDIVLPEHAVEMYRMLPHGQLAVLPSTDHFIRLQSPEWLLSMLADFFNAPMPEAQ
jgi:pimeloyl-ACP methyl ester carboxylesterase